MLLIVFVFIFAQHDYLKRKEEKIVHSYLSNKISHENAYIFFLRLANNFSHGSTKKSLYAGLASRSQSVTTRSQPTVAATPICRWQPNRGEGSALAPQARRWMKDQEGSGDDPGWVDFDWTPPPSSRFRSNSNK